MSNIDEANIIISEEERPAQMYKLFDLEGHEVECSRCGAVDQWSVEDPNVALLEQVFTCEGVHKLISVGGTHIRPFETVYAADLSLIEPLPPQAA